MTSRILELANSISEKTSIIHQYLLQNNLPFPSFAYDAINSLPKELVKAQDAVLDATSELNDVLMPQISAFNIDGNVSQSSSYPQLLVIIYDADSKSYKLQNNLPT
jgi:hypothetical protein